MCRRVVYLLALAIKIICTDLDSSRVSEVEVREIRVVEDEEPIRRSSSSSGLKCIV